MSYRRAALANIEDLCKELETGPGGLSDQEAERRLLKMGPNVLPKGKKTNLAGRIVSQFRNMFNVLLLIASSLSFVSGLFFNDAGSIQMGLAILAVVFLNAIFSLFQEYRAQRAVLEQGVIPVNNGEFRYKFDPKRLADKIKTYDIINLVNGRPEIGRVVHLTFFSKEKGATGPYHSFVRVILRGTTAIYVKDR